MAYRNQTCTLQNASAALTNTAILTNDPDDLRVNVLSFCMQPPISVPVLITRWMCDIFFNLSATFGYYMKAKGTLQRHKDL
jgi:hypothetical protein